jgi:hypothetical protein
MGIFLVFSLAAIFGPCDTIPVLINENLQTLQTCKYMSRKENGTQCPPGCFQKKDTCHLCPVLSYNNVINSNSCHQCGINSVNNHNFTRCICKQKHFRRVKEKLDYDKPCIKTLPYDLSYNIIDDTYLSVRWIGVLEELEIGNISYTLECKSCKPTEYFRITTHANSIMFHKPVTNKFYKVTLTVSYIDALTRLHKILHVLSDNIFIGVDSTDPNEAVVIIVVGITVPIVLIFLICCMIMYITQRRRQAYFQDRLVSLKRKSRPPLPPQSLNSNLEPGTYEPKTDEPDNYKIEPYAVLDFTHILQQYDSNRPTNPEEQEKLIVKNDKEDSPTDYVKMEGNNQKRKKPQNDPYRQECRPNDYIIREHIAKREHNAQRNLRPRPMSWYLQNAGFQHQMRELALNEMNSYDNYELRNRAQSGTVYDPRFITGPEFPNIGSKRSNSYMPNAPWNHFPPKNGSMTPQRQWYYGANQQKMPEYNGRFDQDDINHSVWPMGRHGRVRTQSCLDQNPIEYPYPRYLQLQANRNKNFVPFPPTLFDEEDIFEERSVRDSFTPRFEQRGRSRTVMCGNEDFNNFLPRQRSRTIICPGVQPIEDFERRSRSRTTLCIPEPKLNENTLSFLEQAKLATKYKRAESKENLCAADYVKLKRPHSADDINKVYGMEK